MCLFSKYIWIFAICKEQTNFQTSKSLQWYVQNEEEKNVQNEEKMIKQWLCKVTSQ